MIAPGLRSQENRTADYRRAARRLRGRLAQNPARLQQSLRELAAACDQRLQPVWRMQQASGIGPTEQSQRDFVQCVTEHLDGPVLRYSGRLAVLRRARRLGIGRFEANLIIAAVQHRAGRGNKLREKTGTRFVLRRAFRDVAETNRVPVSAPDRTGQGRQPWPALAGAGIVCTVELLILVSAYLVLA